MLFAIGTPAANALTFGFSSIPVSAETEGGNIAFDGDADSFAFLPTAAASFQIDSVAGGTGDAVGNQGNILGEFAIGSITDGSIPGAPGVFEYAEVTGDGTFQVYAGEETLTATISFDSIYTYDVNGSSSGGVQTEGTANIIGISYAGSNQDLLALANFGAASGVISFQFTPGLSLTDLTADGTTNSTSYSGTLSAVPIPAAAWLFGSALVGMAGIGYRRRRA
jgi:hypothetical protein